jgi:hypothetical protein
MKKVTFFAFSLVILFLGFIFPKTSFPLALYDDFSETYIDRTKWIYGELVREIREIEPGNYKLFLKQASSNPRLIPILGASYPYYETHTFNFINPSSVNSIRADVTILENSITNSGVTAAACAGNWYSDGTPGGGMIGDIQAAVALKGGPSGLFASWRVSKIMDSQGTTWTDLGGGDFATPITNGTTYTLYIEYDSVNNRFIFRLGGEEVEFSTGLPPRAGNANIPSRGLSTRVRIDNAISSAYISATFDNVYKNGFLYDDFSSSIIDSTKWNSYEFVREISSGKLRTKVRTSSASNNEVDNDLPSIVPIKAVQAKVTLLDYQNPPGPYIRVGVAVNVGGAFYSDGTPGEGQIGDVQANVRIIANESSTLQPDWEVSRCPDSECNGETLANGVFTTPIVLGNTYTLFIEWDGNQFTLKFNDEVAHYTPTSGSINAAKLPFVNLSTEVNASPGHNKEATIEALYDDVMIRSISTYFDTVQKTYIGYYQRPADPGGLIYWAERLDATGGNLTEIIEAFANSAESQALYGTINSSNISTVVNGIYNALFGRNAEAGGLSYYVNGFNSGQYTPATIMLNVLYGAQNEDLQSINNKLTAANLFTRTIDPELDGKDFQVTYAGNSDVIAARSFLSFVTSSSTTVPTQDETTAYIKTNIADPGDPILNP